MLDITILKLGDCLIVPLKADLDDDLIREFQEEILRNIEKTDARGLVIDVSVLSVIDSFLGRVLVETAKMAQLMGTSTVVVGLKKEVVLTLIHLGLPLSITTAMTLEQGIELLKNKGKRL